MLQLLFFRGARVDAAEDGGRQAHHCAAQQGHTAGLHLLLGCGAQVDAACGGGDQSLHLASRYGHAPSLQLLLDRGASVRDGGRAVQSAVRERHINIALKLVHYGADIPDYRGQVGQAEDEYDYYDMTHMPSETSRLKGQL